ncbi:MAG: ABC-three component system middle component 6, partial [Rhodomicrobium sp.]
MILPSKHLSEQRALISVGAEILVQLKRPLDVSDLWEKVRDAHHSGNADDNLSFDWFTLAL